MIIELSDCLTPGISKEHSEVKHRQQPYSHVAADMHHFLPKNLASFRKTQVLFHNLYRSHSLHREDI